MKTVSSTKVPAKRPTETLSVPMWAVLFRIASGERMLHINSHTQRALRDRGLIEPGSRLTEKGSRMVYRVVEQIRYDGIDS